MAANSAGVGWLRCNGGAAKASRVPLRRISTKPALHCCTTVPARRGAPPCCSQAWQVPKVGCPANAISLMGVKMRTW